MTSSTEITVQQCSQFIGRPGAPAIVDVRLEEDFALDPRLIPGSRRRSHLDLDQWRHDLAGQRVIVVCQRGRKLSQGVAALLRCHNLPADILIGGFEAWAAADQPAIASEALPARDRQGRTLWVTAARPGAQTLACAWLIRRFADPQAGYLFVSPDETAAVAERFGARRFGTDLRDPQPAPDRVCFDEELQTFDLRSAPLLHLARILRDVETAHANPLPQAAGLQAALQGLTGLYDDDLELLSATMPLYDGLYHWCLAGADHASGRVPSVSAAGSA